jgi:hypothetical protein
MGYCFKFSIVQCCCYDVISALEWMHDSITSLHKESAKWYYYYVTIVTINVAQPAPPHNQRLPSLDQTNLIPNCVENIAQRVCQPVAQSPLPALQDTLFPHQMCPGKRLPSMLPIPGKSNVHDNLFIVTGCPWLWTIRNKHDYSSNQYNISLFNSTTQSHVAGETKKDHVSISTGSALYSET